MHAFKGSRSVLALASFAILGLAAANAAAQSPERHGKSAKQCEAELKANAAALAKAGESPAEFFHTCWWQSAAGAATPIHGTRAAPAPARPAADATSKAKAEAEMAKARREIATAKSQTARAEAEAAKTRRALMLEAAKAEAAARAEKAAQARAAAAESAVKAQTEAAAKTRAEAAAKAERAARDAAAAKARADAAQAKAKAEASARAKAAAERAAAVEVAQAARVQAAADALQKAKREQAARIEAAAAALAAAKAEQTKAEQTKAEHAKTETAKKTAVEPAQRDDDTKATGATRPEPAHPAAMERKTLRPAVRPAREAFVRRPVSARHTFYRARRIFAEPVSRAPRARSRELAAVSRPSEAPNAFGMVMVPVEIPGVGLERPIPWPVLPAYVPAFRSAVNHPIVPGFTRTP